MCDILKFSDNEIVSQALDQWANFIETGSILTSAVDLVAMSDSNKSLFIDKRGLKVKALTSHQM